MPNFDRTNNLNLLAAFDSDDKEPFSSNRDSISSEVAANGEGWVALCARAAVEQDPKKLLELVSEINRLLDARRKRLTHETDGEVPR